MVKLAAVVSHTLMWISAGVVHAQASASANTQRIGPTLTEDGIYISLPVFVASLISTAVFTWRIAKYDHHRKRQIEKIEQKLNKIAGDDRGGEAESDG